MCSLRGTSPGEGFRGDFRERFQGEVSGGGFRGRFQGEVSGGGFRGRFLGEVSGGGQGRLRVESNSMLIRLCRIDILLFLLLF